MSFEQFLLWAQNEGINTILGVFSSFAVEWWPQFGEFTERQKRLIVAGINLGIPVLAALVAVLMGYQPWSFELTFWPALVAGGASFFGSQVAHLRKLS